MANGQPTTASFLSGLMGAVPPLQNLFDIAGMKLPEYLGQQKITDKTPDAGKVEKKV